MTDFLLQSLWFWELVLLCSWAPTLTGCSFVVLLGRSCFTALTGRPTSRGPCALACKYLAERKGQAPVLLTCTLCGHSAAPQSSSKVFVFLEARLELLAAVGSVINRKCPVACVRSGKISFWPIS